MRARVCERGRERETGSHHSGVCCLNRGLCANTYELHHCVCHVTLFPSRVWTDGKTKDIINCLYIYFESWSSWLWKGVRVTFPTSACGVRPVTMHCASWPIRADCVGRRDFVENDAFERGGHRGPTIMYSIWKICVFLTLKHVNIFCYTKYTK